MALPLDEIEEKARQLLKELRTVREAVQQQRAAADQQPCICPYHSPNF